MLAIVAAHYLTDINSTLLFWLAFILTRPLGATVGDLLTKARDQGGLDLGTISSSAIIAVVLVAFIALASKRAESPLREHPG